MPAADGSPELMSRPPSFGDRVRSGEVVVGMMVLDFFTPALPRVLGQAGLDFAIFDMESTGLTFDRLEMLVALSHGAGLAPLVRVPTAAPSSVARCLDLGAVGVMAPKIRDVDEAREFARAARFPPDGVRGSGYQAYPDGFVTPVSAAERQAANAATVTICQLETAEAIDRADQIVPLPGIDVVIVGANDLASDLGVDPGDPRVRAAVTRVRELCVAHGKALGGRPARPDGEVPLSPGHRLVLVDHDTAALSTHTRASLATLGLRKESAI